MDMTVRPLVEADRPWAVELMRERWGGAIQVVNGRARDASLLEGFIAEENGEPMGLVTYEMRGAEAELVTLNSLREHAGIGSALVAAVAGEAWKQGCRKLSVVTTNDNVNALRFYQRRGFVLSALRTRELERSRRIKPEIPELGLDDIPIRDELELMLVLDGPAAPLDAA
jgi:ribosomal protein S18 acetylase RimI-like enzyme